MQTILTPSQAKSARKFLEISQSYASQAIGINRAYLSQFENGKINLDETELDSIKEFYVLEGYEFDNEFENADSENHSSELLKEIKANEQKIIELCKYNIRQNHLQEPLFAEPYIKADDLNKYVSEVLILLATNHILAKQVNSSNENDVTKEFSKAETTGDFVSVLLEQSSTSLFEHNEDNWF